MQFAFWFTLGFLFVGWIIDFFRLPGMVGRLNEDRARELMSEYKMMHQSNAAPVIHTIVQQAAPTSVAVSTPPPARPATHQSKFFCYVSEEVQGPFDMNDLQLMRNQNKIDDVTQCCREGSEEWTTYERIKA